jgi:hypothetical protein
MKNITELRNDLLDVYEKLRAGSMEIKEAKEINNTAGKIISSAKVQIEYATVRGEKPDIDFMK